ncbi:MAG: hypothetical protein ACYTXY_26155, partial [Nostoc sp.]
LDFIFALIYLFVIVVILTAIASCFNDLPKDRKILFFVFLPTLFSSFQTLNFINTNKYSRLKTLNIIIFPFALIISASFVLLILYDKKILVSKENDYIFDSIKNAIVSLIYLPFIPFIKAQLTRQLFLPKD